MNKDESKMMQGVAILLMLFLHLFNSDVRVNTWCSSFLTIGNDPLVFILSRAANPVSFFLVLSGYGLSCIYHSGKLTPRGQLRRISRLYFFYALVLLVFAGIGSILRPDKYPGSVSECLLNLTGWSYSYNAEMWFLLPYVLVSVTSVYLFRLKDKLGIWTMLILSLFLNLGTSFLISRYGKMYLYGNEALYLPVLYLSFFLPFYLGSYLHDIARRRGSLSFSLPYGRIVFPALLLLLVALRCSTAHSYLYPVYAALFILLFHNCPRHKCLNAFLLEMGRMSMLMWFVHTFYSEYLFTKFIFSPRQPLLVFLLLLVCSYLTALVINKVGAPIYNRILNFCTKH